jgi:hypothetical protein
MITRVAIPLLLLPLIALALPLVFAWAWVHEAISERALPIEESSDADKGSHCFHRERLIN